LVLGIMKITGVLILSGILVLMHFSSFYSVVVLNQETILRRDLEINLMNDPPITQLFIGVFAQILWCTSYGYLVPQDESSDTVYDNVLRGQWIHQILVVHTQCAFPCVHYIDALLLPWPFPDIC